MTQFLDQLAELVIWTAIAAAVGAVAVYVVGRLRAGPVQKEPMAGELLAKFREMHARGELADAEFRTIKTKLAPHPEEESKDNGETG